MSYIKFSSDNNIDAEKITMGKNTIYLGEYVELFRRFLLADGFSEEAIDEYVLNESRSNDSVQQRRPLTVNVHVEDKKDVDKIIEKLMKKSEIRSAYI